MSSKEKQDIEEAAQLLGSLFYILIPRLARTL